MSEYVEIVCVVDFCTFKGRNRVRPYDNSVFSSDQWIECAKEISQQHPVGTKVKLYVKEKVNANPSINFDHLYSSYKRPYKILK